MDRNSDGPILWVQDICIFQWRQVHECVGNNKFVCVCARFYLAPAPGLALGLYTGLWRSSRAGVRGTLWISTVLQWGQSMPFVWHNSLRPPQAAQCWIITGQLWDCQGCGEAWGRESPFARLPSPDENQAMALLWDKTRRKWTKPELGSFHLFSWSLVLSPHLTPHPPAARVLTLPFPSYRLSSP